MRLPRLFVRRMMAGVAILALLLGIAVEFRDGSPPRFVVRGIPARIHRLKPGMSWQQARDVLGLEASWLRGGTSARYFIGDGNGHYQTENYTVGTDWTSSNLSGSWAMIQIHFDTRPRGPESPANYYAYRADEATRLTGASFSYGGKVLAEMPGGQ